MNHCYLTSHLNRCVLVNILLYSKRKKNIYLFIEAVPSLYKILMFLAVTLFICRLLFFSCSMKDESKCWLPQKHAVLTNSLLILNLLRFCYFSAATKTNLYKQTTTIACVLCNFYYITFYSFHYNTKFLITVVLLFQETRIKQFFSDTPSFSPILPWERK